MSDSEGGYLVYPDDVEDVVAALRSQQMHRIGEQNIVAEVQPKFATGGVVKEPPTLVGDPAGVHFNYVPDINGPCVPVILSKGDIDKKNVTINIQAMDLPSVAKYLASPEAKQEIREAVMQAKKRGAVAPDAEADPSFQQFEKLAKAHGWVLSDADRAVQHLVCNVHPDYKHTFHPNDHRQWKHDIGTDVAFHLTACTPCLVNHIGDKTEEKPQEELVPALTACGVCQQEFSHVRVGVCLPGVVRCFDCAPLPPLPEGEWTALGQMFVRKFRPRRTKPIGWNARFSL